MKRFLILFILIVFVTMSCAGPNKVKVGWTKPDFLQDQFENDRKECIDSIDKNLNSNAFGKVLEECLGKKKSVLKKSYTYESTQDAEKTKEEPTTKERIITAGKTVGIVLLGITVATLYYGLMFAPRK